MENGVAFFANSIFLAVGLGVDAFSLALINGMNEPLMKKRKICGVSSIFAIFQCVVSFISWVCVSTIAKYFVVLERIIPYVAFALLGFIGGKMLYRGIKHKANEEYKPTVGIGALLLQGFATSIDEAFSVGFAIVQYHCLQVIISCLIIGIITFGICYIGIVIGKKAGMKLSTRAEILGGSILVFIGLEILITNLL